MAQSRQPAPPPGHRPPPPPRPRKPGARLVELINIIAGIIQVIIIITFVLRMLRADKDHMLVKPVYALGDFLVGPFVGIIPPIALGSGAFLDLTPLLAIVVYILLTALLTKVVSWAFGLFARRRQA